VSFLFLGGYRNETHRLTLFCFLLPTLLLPMIRPPSFINSPRHDPRRLPPTLSIMNPDFLAAVLEPALAFELTFSHRCQWCSAPMRLKPPPKFFSGFFHTGFSPQAGFSCAPTFRTHTRCYEFSPLVGVDWFLSLFNWLSQLQLVAPLVCVKVTLSSMLSTLAKLAPLFHLPDFLGLNQFVELWVPSGVGICAKLRFLFGSPPRALFLVRSPSAFDFQSFERSLPPPKWLASLRFSIFSTLPFGCPPYLPPLLTLYSTRFVEFMSSPLRRLQGTHLSPCACASFISFSGG